MQLSLKRALFYVVVSTLVISGVPWAGWGIYHYFLQSWQADSAYQISAIIQETKTPSEVHRFYLQQLLDLSIDDPPNAYLYSWEKATRNLLQSPVIQEAQVRLWNPTTLLVRYEACRPVAYVGECRHLAIDEKGQLIPSDPLYTPKRLPKVFLGLSSKEASSSIWRQTIPTSQLAVQALRQVSSLLSPNTSLLTLDLSRAFAESSGQREIVAVFREQWGEPVVRFNADYLEQGIEEYRALRRHFLRTTSERGTRPALVDLRSPGLGFYIPNS